MKKAWVLLCILWAFEFALPAQEAGNIVYGGSRRRTSGVTTGNLSGTEAKDATPVAFIEANLLMNVKADEYVAVFALAQEAPTVPETNDKIAAQLREFISALQSLGIKTNDIFVDLIAQNRVYDTTIAGNVAREALTGFELKKTVAVRYKDRALLDKMLAAAAKSSIFDLVKVDYVVNDLAALRKKLLAEASAVIKQKEAAYARLFGVKMRAGSLAAEKYNAFFPSEMYDTYVAYEASAPYRGPLPVEHKRKTSTSYYSPLAPAEFDLVINPTSLEPVVQLTLYVKMRYTSAR
jgi:uncharacterized protein YggE